MRFKVGALPEHLLDLRLSQAPGDGPCVVPPVVHHLAHTLQAQQSACTTTASMKEGIR